MIELYYWPTPNGHKITIFLEEVQLPYKIIPVNISKGDQFGSNFLEISPNNRIPAIIDKGEKKSNSALSVFESGAILQYLAQKTGKFYSENIEIKTKINEWLFWQMAGLGPMLGQNHHFVKYAPEKINYAIDRYVSETSRLYAVLDKRLKEKDFIVDNYSIADIACYPWIVPHKRQNQNLDDFPNLKRWFLSIKERKAVKSAYEKGRHININPVVDKDSKKILFGQNANSIKNRF